MRRTILSAVAVGLSIFAARADFELPAKFVDYIESHGTEYLDLGNVLTSNTVATVDFTMVEANNYVSYFGNTRNFAFITWDWIYTRGKRVVTEAHHVAGKRSVITIDAGAQKIWLDGTEQKLEVADAYESGKASAQAGLFCSGKGDGKSKIRVHSCVITNDSQLAMDLRPCVDADGVACMYDMASRQFFRNAGTGMFTASSTEVPYPDELLRNSLTIEANTTHYAGGALSPTYGVYPFLAASSNIVCTAPASWTSPSGCISLTCTGYKLYLYDFNSSTWTLSASGDKSTYTYVHADGQRAKLEWQFDVTKTVVQLTTADDIVARIATGADGDEFSLAAGTYELTVPLVISAGCKVIGAGKDETILKQTTADIRVVVMANSGAWLQDCQITGANFTTEHQNTVGALHIPATGGGVVTNCHICGNRNNQNQNKGLGVFCESANALITHCIVNDNKTTGSASNNSQGGMCLFAGHVDHCLVYGNSGCQAGGIGLEGPATVSYCTIVANWIHSSATSSTGGGVAAYKGYFYSPGTGGGVFENCVIYGNTCSDTYTGAGRPEVCADLAVTFRNCAFPKTVTLPAKATNEGSMFVDVLFTDFANGDYTQKFNSPAKDLGYYTPYQGSAELVCECTASTTALLKDSSITFTSSVDGTNGTDTVTYAWVVTKPDKTTETLTAANPVYVPTQAGDYSVLLTVTRNAEDSKTADHTLDFTTYAATTPIATADALVKALSNLCDGVSLELEAKTYELTTLLILNKASTIKGQGIDKTILKQTVEDKRLVELRNRDAVISGCTMTGVTVKNETGNAAAVYIPEVYGGGTVTNCRITANTCSRNQDKCCGIYCTSANGVIAQCIIDNNKVTNESNETEGGIRLTAGTVDHCLIYKNVGHQTGGICIDGPATVRWCTIVANEVHNPSYNGSVGGGIAVRYTTSGATVEHSIIYGNTCPDTYTGKGKPEIWFYDTAAATFTDCAFPTTITLPSGVKGTPFQCEVQFKDFANGDYRQKISSPAKDIGYYTPFDAGSEFTCEIIGDKTSFLLGDSVRLTSYVGGTNGSDAVAYAWTVTRPDATTETLTEANPLYVPTQAGDHSVALSVTKNGTVTTNAPTTVAFTAYATPTPIATVAELEKAAANPCEGLVLQLAADTFTLTKRLEMTVAYTIRGAGWKATTIRPGYTDKQVLKLENAGAVLEGVTVTGGNINNTEGIHGAGVQIGTGGGTVRNCRIMGNKIQKNWTHGAGVAMLSAAALLDHCLIVSNSLPAAVNHYAGGVYMKAGVMDSCLVTGNSLKDGGNSYNYLGGGVFVEGTATIRNCTIVGNAGGNGGGGIYVGANKTCAITNTIIAGNTTTSRDTNVGAPEWGAGSGAKFKAAGCLFPAGTVTNATTGAGWLLADPVFKNAAKMDYRPCADSPVVDAGVLYDGITEKDLRNRPRVSCGIPDIGCYEYRPGLILLVR